MSFNIGTSSTVTASAVDSVAKMDMALGKFRFALVPMTIMAVGLGLGLGLGLFYSCFFRLAPNTTRKHPFPRTVILIVS